MSFIVTLMAIIQSFAISLGVGSSTLAILNFFSAIKDGTIDPTERRMMGIVYNVLRVAMGAILLTTLFLIISEQVNSESGVLSTYAFGQITALVLLFLNAGMMTKQWMPSTFGPALQAASWYTLGTLAALAPLGLTDFSYAQFLLGYLAWVILAIGVTNAMMAYMKYQLDSEKENPV